MLRKNGGAVPLSKLGGSLWTHQQIPHAAGPLGVAKSLTWQQWKARLQLILIQDFLVNPDTGHPPSNPDGRGVRHLIPPAAQRQVTGNEKLADHFNSAGFSFRGDEHF